MLMFRLVAVAIVTVALAGCAGSREGDLVGKWKGKSITSNASGESNPLAGMVNAAAQMVSLDFSKDHHFQETLMMIPVKGNWTMAGSTVSMHTTEAMGFDLDKVQNGQGDNNRELTATLSPDGKTLTVSGSKGGDFTLERDSSQ